MQSFNSDKDYEIDIDLEESELDVLDGLEIKQKKIKLKNKEEYYVNPIDFKNAITEFYKTGICTDYLGQCLNKIAEGLGYNGKFINYCVDEQTEALTKRGWLKYNEITLNDIILSYDTENKELAWSRVLDIFKGDHNDLMFKLTCPGLDALVTPNHKFVSLEDGIKPIEEFNSNDHFVLMGSHVPMDEQNKIYSDEFVKYAQNTNTLDMDLIVSLTQEQRLNIIKSICSANDNVIFKNKIKLNEFVALCTISGFSTETDISESEKYYTVRIIKDSLNNCSFTDLQKDNNITKVPYNGVIWCPQTQYGTFVCRRGKYVYVTGNSFKEDMIGDALIKMYSALKRKKFDVNGESSPFGYFTTIAFHAFINRIKKEKKHHDALSEYKQRKYEEYMSETEGHIYVKPIIDSTEDNSEDFGFDYSE